MDNLIFLIGFRAVGKTTIGQELARKQGFDFLDTDRIICQNSSSSIASIVKEKGWERFRNLEKEVLEGFVGCNNCVIATGGGAVLHDQSWQIYKEHSLIVWLSASSEVLIDRLQKDTDGKENRPSLTGRDMHSELLEIMRQREPLYRKIAHVEIDTGIAEIPEIVRGIQQLFAQHKGQRQE
jgi:shikimate kinase